METIRSTSTLGKTGPELLHEIHADEHFQIVDLDILPFRISHDAAEPVAYRVAHEEHTVAVCTDLGYYDDYIIEHLKGLNAVLLNQNRYQCVSRSNLLLPETENLGTEVIFPTKMRESFSPRSSMTIRNTGDADI